MKYIDLHVHSNYSDGSLPPASLVEKAVQQELAAFALTDHDTIEGIPEAMAAATICHVKGIEIEVIPGIELSLAYKGRDIHMLGLFIDYKNEAFQKTLTDIKEERESRNEKMVQNMKDDGIPISMAELREEDEHAVITRAHFAKHLIKKGYCKSTKDAFLRYLSEDGPYYVPRKYLTPQEGIDLIRSVGGVPVLAHPLLYHFSHDELDTLIRTLKEGGLAGLEVIYSINTKEDENYLRKFANQYELLISGGSDYHGEIKPLIEMGVGKGNLKIPYELLDGFGRGRHK